MPSVGAFCTGRHTACVRSAIHAEPAGVAGTACGLASARQLLSDPPVPSSLSVPPLLEHC
eukprot:353762-Chlamydomonas_euryale.AAC.4